MDADFENAIFVGDLKMLAVNSQVTEDQVIDAFWESDTDLRSALQLSGASTFEAKNAIRTECLPELKNILKTHGIEVVKG